jgi:hypothetical protein
LLELLFGVTGGGEPREEGAVERVSEQEIDTQQHDFHDGNLGLCRAGHPAFDKSGTGENESEGDPDGDLGDADGSDADEFAGKHVGGFYGGKHDLKDARGFLLNDGAAHVHAVHHDGKGEKEGHSFAKKERAEGT